MSVESIEQLFFTNVGVMRNDFDVARNMFDIQIDTDGIVGYVVWQRNNFRIPLYSHIKDFLKRKNRDNIPREDTIKSDDRNFFIPFDQIQGVVTHDEHKEVKILSSSEQLIIIFRPINDYNAFIEAITQNLEGKIFNRESTEVTPSVYIS